MNTATLSTACFTLVLLFACIARGEEYHPSAADIEAGYIHPGAQVFSVPACAGDHYDDTVPDTLDLAKMADLALNGLTGPNDPLAGYELYFMANFQANPPVMSHDFGDPCQVKFLGPLLLLRTITGTDTGRDIEEKMFTAYLRAMGPDGLWYPPLQGRKWFRENLWDEAKSGEPETAALPPYEGGQLRGRILEAMLILWKLSGDRQWRDLADRMVSNGVEGSLERFVRDTNEWGVASGTDESRLPRGFLACDAWTPQAMAQYARLTQNDLAVKAAYKMVLRQKGHIDFFAPDGSFILTTPGVSPAHFHVHALSILGFLDYGLAANDRDIIEYAMRSYEWARAQGSATTGFYPEKIEKDCPNSEGCVIADMVALALKLSQAGVGDYWDDADRWLRNAFAEFQLTPEKARLIAADAARRETRAPRWNETAERVIERNVGAFAGWPGANEWLCRIGIQHCCTGNCARTLYYAWGSILEHRDDTLRVNLLLNRASPWADVYSCIPNEGRVEIQVKAACHDVLLRAPEWVADKDSLHCSVGGAGRPVTWDGRYVRLGAAAAGERLVVTFPVGERTVHERIGGIDCTLTLRGTTVVAVDPPGTVCPLYQRAALRAEKAHWSPVRRFAARQPVDW